MAIHITLLSALFSDDSEQEVRVRPDLTVTQLIGEILREYDLPSGRYCLTLGGGSSPLPREQTLQNLGVKTGAVLVFAEDEGSGGLGPADAKGARLRAATGEEFELRRQPALIGRPNLHAGITREMLDVDLSALDPDRTSSRPHAQIRCVDGHYYVESLRDDNRAFVNEESVAPATPHRLLPGEWLRFGSVRMQFLLDK